MQWRWLRLWHDVADDPKVQGLGEDFQRWINCMIAASRNDPRGQLPALPQLAFCLRLTLEQAEALRARLQDRGLLDCLADGTFVIHNWAERQFESDNSTERWQKWREKQLETNVGTNVGPTLEPTYQRQKPETEADTDQSQKQHKPKKQCSLPLAFKGEHLDVTRQQDRLLGEAFPWVDRGPEYARMDSWLEANPKKRPKSVAKFAHNWMSRIDPPREGKNGTPRKSQRAVPAKPGKYDHIKPDLIVS